MKESQMALVLFEDMYIASLGNPRRASTRPSELEASGGPRGSIIGERSGFVMISLGVLGTARVRQLSFFPILTQ